MDRDDVLLAASGYGLIALPDRWRTLPRRTRQQQGARLLAELIARAQGGEADVAALLAEAGYQPSDSRSRRWKRTALPTRELPGVTAGITSYERPDHLARLIESLRLRYPRVPIVVADNSRRRPRMPDGVRVIELPEDAGLSACRNALAASIESEWLLLLEDDFRLTDATQLELLLDVGQSDPQLGCVLGSVRETTADVQLDFVHDLRRGPGATLVLDTACRPWRSTPAGTRYRVVDLGPNFGLWRRDLLGALGWPEWLKLGEHVAYFHQLWQQPTHLVAYVPTVEIEHDKEGRSAEYTAARQRGTELHAEWLATAGYQSLRRMPPPPAASGTPSIVLMGVGHSGTTIAARMLGDLGWSLLDADTEFAESVTVRAANNVARRHGRLPATAWELLDRAGPWVVKDPRFVWTLRHWQPIFAALEVPPLLVWLTKEPTSVEASYARRGALGADSARIARHVADALAAARESYRRWPWARVRVDYESIARACGMFSPR